MSSTLQKHWTGQSTRHGLVISKPSLSQRLSHATQATGSGRNQTWRSRRAIQGGSECTNYFPCLGTRRGHAAKLDECRGVTPCCNSGVLQPGQLVGKVESLLNHKACGGRRGFCLAGGEASLPRVLLGEAPNVGAQCVTGDKRWWRTSRTGTARRKKGMHVPRNGETSRPGNISAAQSSKPHPSNHRFA